MLGEMLLHFTTLSDDMTATLRNNEQRLVNEVRTSTEQARGLIAEHTKAHEKAIERSTERLENTANIITSLRNESLAQFSRDTEAVFKKTVIRQAGVRIWASWTIVSVLVGALLLLAYLQGSEAGLAQARAEFAATKIRSEIILTRLGPKIPNQWLDLMDWNDLKVVQRNCEPQLAGDVYRKACFYGLWNAPPVQVVSKP